jgi:hypothetical protein
MKESPPTLYLFAGSSRRNFTTVYAPLADLWTVWDNQPEPPRLILSSESATLSSFTELQ